jgi:hypothetical protein
MKGDQSSRAAWLQPRKKASSWRSQSHRETRGGRTDKSDDKASDNMWSTCPDGVQSLTRVNRAYSRFFPSVSFLFYVSAFWEKKTV